MKTYVLVRRPSDDYSTLPPYEFIFDEVPSVPTARQLSETIARLTTYTDNSSVEDKIVLNGPTWLIAVASYYWLTRRAIKENSLSIMVYNIGARRYVDMPECQI